jgi:acyl carrier protein
MDDPDFDPSAVPAAPVAHPELGQRVRVLVAESLDKPLELVKLESSLMDELGAESLDMLDIVFRLERAFGIQITRGEMERAARGDMSDDEFAPAGVVSEAGLQRLRALMPEATPRIRPGLRPFQILSLFTVQTLANIVAAKASAKPPPNTEQKPAP